MENYRAFFGTLLLAGASLSPVAAQTPRAATGDQSISARLQRLEDVEEIRTLLTEYAHTLDARDLVAYSNLFAKDGEWVGGFGTGKGPAGVLALMQKNMATNPGGTFHIMSNFMIEVHGDTATAWSRWAYVVPGAGNQTVIASSGHYDDTLVREDGHWKFKRRVAGNNTPNPRAGK
jgi:uncharacterized protein (TIGR02246 family)